MNARRTILSVLAATAVLVPVGAASVATGVVAGPVSGGASVEKSEVSVEAVERPKTKKPRGTCGNSPRIGLC